MTTTATPKSTITDEQAALIGTRWEGNNGTVRYYINDWAAVLGFEIDRSHSGAIRSCHISGVDMISNRKAEQLLTGRIYIEAGKILSTVDWAAAGVEKPAVGDIIRAEIARREA